MVQTIMQVGNSLAVTLPKDYVKARKLKAGQKIFVDADPSVDFIQVHTNEQTSSITPEFKKWLDEFTEEHADVLQQLAKR